MNAGKRIREMDAQRHELRQSADQHAAALCRCHKLYMQAAVERPTMTRDEITQALIEALLGEPYSHRYSRLLLRGAVLWP